MQEQIPRARERGGHLGSARADFGRLDHRRREDGLSEASRGDQVLCRQHAASARYRQSTSAGTGRRCYILPHHVPQHAVLDVPCDLSPGAHAVCHKVFSSMCGGARMWDADGGQESIPARSIFGRSASARLCPPRCAPASTPPAPVRTIGMGHTSSNISRNMSQMPVVNNTISVCVDAGQSASSQAWNSYLQVALYPVLARFNPRVCR